MLLFCSLVFSMATMLVFSFVKTPFLPKSMGDGGVSATVMYGFPFAFKGVNTSCDPPVTEFYVPGFCFSLAFWVLVFGLSLLVVYVKSYKDEDEDL